VNLAISAVCNQACPYCFTADHTQRWEEGPRYLPLVEMESRLAFLKRSDVDQVRLIGGEPTLHPQFDRIVERARASGLRLVVFSNGRMPARALDCLAALPADVCTVMVNANDPDLAGREQHAQRLVALRRLGRRAILGFNIYRAGFQPAFLLTTIAETGCQPVVRLGMAQPCLSGSNRSVHPSQYVAIGRRIAAFVRDAARAGVSVQFDCGFVRCMFSERDLEDLEVLSDDVGWRCNPILDVDLVGRVIHCFPLSDLASLPLDSAADASGLRAAFESRTRVYRQAGVYQECSSCPFKANGECPGGCLAVTVRRFRHTPFRVAVPASSRTPSGPPPKREPQRGKAT
jgi:hypothetical protein